MEEEYGTKFTDKICADADAVIMADVRKEIRKRDKEKMQLERCAVKTSHLTEVVKRGGSWPALWDVALHLGSSRHTAGLQHLMRILAHHGHGLKPCPMCGECWMRSLIDHILDAHGKELELPVLLSTDKLLTLIMELNGI